jgi:DNA end-binding protein Ku
MPRAIWTGTLGFGLVEIPIRLHSAVSAQDEIQFTQLDRRDLAPVGYERVNKKTGAKVQWEDIVKGYEYDSDQYVVLTKEDLERANVEATQTIDIVDFVDAAEVESVYWDTPYYLEPTKKKSKSFALLRETLRRTSKVAIAKVVIRTRQRLAALIARGDAIVLNVLRYAYEIKDPDELELPKGSLEELGLSEKEIRMAEELVESMTTHWKPEAYKDEYRADVLAMVEKKVKAGKIRAIEEPEAPAKKPRRAEVIDLMPLLKRSLQRTRSVASAAPKRSPRKTARKRA